MKSLFAVCHNGILEEVDLISVATSDKQAYMTRNQSFAK